MSKFCISKQYHSETFWISAKLFDRYLSTVEIKSKKNCYLVAHGAVFITAKIHEELLEPHLIEMVGKCQYKITEKMIKVLVLIGNRTEIAFALPVERCAC